jgi:hypothetical protein
MKRALLIDLVALAIALAAPLTIRAQDSSGATPNSTQAATETKPKPFKPEELEQIAAPIALYPDTLLAQIFMASTYPLEIVQAARWSKANPEVKGDAVAKAVEQQPWDASVKSLVAFPDVLTMMDEKIDWTQKLGDAFLAQQKEIMDAVQRLRAKAKEAGNLESTKQQVVKAEPAPAGAATPQVIVIESSSPEIIYVPTYNPTVVYGGWPYPAYPPYYYYPPAYVPGAALFSFSVGVAVGGALWGNCNWGGSDVDIDVNRYNNFNRNEINANRNTNVNNRGNNTSNKWQHNAEHRQGVGYRDSATQQKYSRAGSSQGAQSREEYRGRGDQGRQSSAGAGSANTRDFSAPTASTRNAGESQYRDFGSSTSRDSASAQQRQTGAGEARGASTSDYGGTQARDRSSSSSASRSNDAFSGVGQGGSTRAQSSRGSASRGGGGGRRR